MTKPAPFFRTFAVGDRMLTVSIPNPSRHEPMHPTLTWKPEAPPLLMSDRELADYALGRDAVLRDLCEHVGTTMNDVLSGAGK